MASSWGIKRVLILVRTYPVPANKGVEVSCTAAVTENGEWIRLFPVPYRYLPMDKRFEKYQWVDLSVQKSSRDTRPESYHLNLETIKLGSKIAPTRGWADRKSRLKHLIRPSLCAIQQEQEVNGSPTLGLFRPGRIKRLVIKKCAADWTQKEKVILGQQTLGFQFAPNQQLEKIPYDFTYEFTCADPSCRGHKMKCTDWEMGEACRQWRNKYGEHWEQQFRAKFERDMMSKHDTHFFVGTVHMHPNNWMIVGLFYPPKETTPDLFA